MGDGATPDDNAVTSYWTGIKLYCATRTLQAPLPEPHAAAALAPSAAALQAQGEALLRDWHALSDAARDVHERKARFLDVCATLAAVRAKIEALESGAVLGARRKRALVLLPRDRGGDTADHDGTYR